ILPLSCLCSADSKSNSSIRFPLPTATRVSSGWRASISMRMDIEYSPGARGQRSNAAARNCDGLRLREGGMSGKRLCSVSHPANLGRERAGRFSWERTMGVLWHHSSVNLVEPRSIAPAAAHVPRRTPETDIAVSIRACAPQPLVREECWPLDAQFRINHSCVIQAFGFNDLAGFDE